jgi:hypothetical protein
MESNLRPMSLGEILDRTAQLYRTHFLLFLGITIIPIGVIVVLACLVGLVVAWWSTAGADSVSEAAGYVLVAIFVMGVLLVALPVLLAATALAMAAMSHAASRIHLGQTTTIRDAYKSVWHKGWRYIGLLFLEGLFIGAVPFAVYIMFLFLFIGAAALSGSAGAGDATRGVLFVIFLILIIIAMVVYVYWMMIQLSLAFPSCVVEQIGAWTAIKRSWNLSNGTKGRILVLYLLGAVLGWLLSMGVTIPMLIVLALIPGMNDPQHAQTASVVMLIIVYGAGFVIQALIRPIYGISLVLFYYDQRIRQEGFDIEWMMQQAGMVAAPGTISAPALEAPHDVEFPQASKPTSPSFGESQ